MDWKRCPGSGGHARRPRLQHRSTSCRKGNRRWTPDTRLHRCFAACGSHSSRRLWPTAQSRYRRQMRRQTVERMLRSRSTEAQKRPRSLRIAFSRDFPTYLVRAQLSPTRDRHPCDYHTWPIMCPAITSTSIIGRNINTFREASNPDQRIKLHWFQSQRTRCYSRRWSSPAKPYSSISMAFWWTQRPPLLGFGPDGQPITESSPH